MSKQQKAKEEQGYRLPGPSCGNCVRFKSDMTPIKWMVENNEWAKERGVEPRYDLNSPACQKESNLRCTVGGFAVKKTGYCNLWEGKAE